MDSNISDKNILITGANGAMARETIKQLIANGATSIVMACRSKAKGLIAKKEIEDELGVGNKVNLRVIGGFDMNDPKKIRSAIYSLPNNLSFDIVFLAAGFAVFSDDYQAVEWDGKRIEKNIFQNLMGSHVTLKLIKENNLLKPNARVVIAGGEGARGLKGLIEKPEFSTPEELRDYVFLKQTPPYNPMNAIGVSKFCGALWTKKMAEVFKDEHETIWFSPGLTSGSDGLKTLPPFKRWFMNNVLFTFMALAGKSQTPQKGGQKFAECLIGKIGNNGNLIGAPEGKSIGKFTEQTSMNSALSNQALIDEFWKILEELFET